VHVRLCDHDHSAPDALLLWCDCTVVPGGVPSNDLGPLKGGPLSLRAFDFNACWQSAPMPT